jgi:hypothetical protein
VPIAVMGLSYFHLQLLDCVTRCDILPVGVKEEKVGRLRSGLDGGGGGTGQQCLSASLVFHEMPEKDRQQTHSKRSTTHL